MKKWQALTSSEQKYIEIGVLMCFFLGLTLGVYFPAYRAVRAVKSEFKGVETEIDRIELMVGKNRNIKQGLRELQDQIALFRHRFPEKEEQGVKALANTARNNNLEIVSTRIGIKRKSTDNKNKALKFEERDCSFIPVTGQFKGRFQDVVGYFQELESSPDYFVTVERLGLDRVDVTEGILSISIELKLYLFG
ncbi:MAG: hypothetical protein WC450_06435 [Candidatus Omnitrophota bacterium]|jgi:hypothetical protein